MDTREIPELFERCARGEAAAWERMLAEFGSWLEGAVRRSLASVGAVPGDADEPAELMQEVWCRLLAGEGRLLRAFRGRSRGEAAAYLGHVARSVVVDRLRRRLTRKRHAVLVGLAAHDPADLAPGPETRLLRRERRGAARRRLRELLGPHLGRRSRRAVELALLDGLSSREIASRSRGATSVTAVDSLVHRARRRLAVQGIRTPRR